MSTLPYNAKDAINFVRLNASVVERARLARLLGQPVDPAFLRPLYDLQNRDGGFPSRPRPGSASSVDSTLTGLWQIYEVGQFSQPEASRALDFLVSMQRPDGSLDENPNLPSYDLPPWIRPDHLPTQLYLTAYSAYWLGLALRELAPGDDAARAEGPSTFSRADAFHRAIAYLARQQFSAGQLPGYTHTNWIGTAAFLLAGDAGHIPAETGLSYLLSQDLDSWDPSQIAWALDNLLTAGLSTEHTFIQRGVETLLRRQSEDGSWSSEDGPSYAAAATVSALKVLRRVDAATSAD